MEKKEPYATQEEVNKRVARYCDVPPIDLGLGPGSKSHIISAEKITLSFVTIAPNSSASIHHHEAEQIIIVTDGALDVILDGELYHLEKDDTIIIPSNVEHGAYASDRGCNAIDIFSPPRQDLVAKLKAVKASS